MISFFGTPQLNLSTTPSVAALTLVAVKLIQSPIDIYFGVDGVVRSFVSSVLVSSPKLFILCFLTGKLLSPWVLMVSIVRVSSLSCKGAYWFACLWLGISEAQGCSSTGSAAGWVRWSGLKFCQLMKALIMVLDARSSKRLNSESSLCYLDACWRKRRKHTSLFSQKYTYFVCLMLNKHQLSILRYKDPYTKRSAAYDKRGGP